MLYLPILLRMYFKQNPKIHTNSLTMILVVSTLLFMLCFVFPKPMEV